MTDIQNFNQSKANLDEKVCLVKSCMFMAQELENACKGFIRELRIPCSILVNDL